MGKREKDSKGEKLMENEKNIPVAHHLCYVKFWWFSVRIAKWDLFFIKKKTENKHAKPIISDKWDHLKYVRKL